MLYFVIFKSMKDQLYPIVDEKDKIIGYLTKEMAYAKKAMLRSVQVFLYNPQGKLYVQKRGKNKTRYPNYFCASVAGHVEPGESYRKAAIRELKEELGLKKIKKLKFITKEKTPVGNDTYAMMALFTIVTDEPITLLKKEVEIGGFYSIKEIWKLISKKLPFTPAFLHFFAKQHS